MSEMREKSEGDLLSELSIQRAQAKHVAGEVIGCVSLYFVCVCICVCVCVCVPPRTPVLPPGRASGLSDSSLPPNVPD